MWSLALALCAASVAAGAAAAAPPFTVGIELPSQVPMLERAGNALRGTGID